MIKKRLKLIQTIGLAALLGTSTAQGQDTEQGATGSLMKIRIVVGDQVLPATLENSAAAKKFAELLPLELKLEDYHSTEKIADLPSRLPTKDAPAGVDPEVGDITYYAPWGNLAIFYRDFGYSTGLVRLGRIEGSLSALSVKGSVNARIERVD